MVHVRMPLQVRGNRSAERGFLQDLTDPEHLIGQRRPPTMRLPLLATTPVGSVTYPGKFKLNLGDVHFLHLQFTLMNLMTN